MLTAGCRTVGVEEGPLRANARCLLQLRISTEVSGSGRIAMDDYDMVEICRIICRVYTYWDFIHQLDTPAWSFPYGTSQRNPHLRSTWINTDPENQ